MAKTSSDPMIRYAVRKADGSLINRVFKRRYDAEREATNHGWINNPATAVPVRLVPVEDAP